MLKELFISAYLQLFRILFNLYGLLPQKNKIVIIASFAENALFLHRELASQKSQMKIIILCSKRTLYKEFKRKLPDTSIIPFQIFRFLYWCKSIYHLSTSKCVVIDNYYAFLSVIKFRKNVECIQIWHAAGTLKHFGLQDKSTLYRGKAANRRFRRVYGKFDKVVVGSEGMVHVFKEAFHIKPENILRTGIPRTDFFYQTEFHQTIISEYELKFPGMKEKKLILYAPTFRDSQLKNYQIQLDIEKMHQKLGSGYILLIKLHPAVKAAFHYQDLYPGFVFDVSSYSGINELLVIADFLITDYSSIPFEFALLNKPMIFFPYDLQHYQAERGIIDGYMNEVPGPVVFQTEDIIQLILKNEFDLERVCEFSNKWNEYSKGQSSKSLAVYILNQLSEGFS